MMRLVEVELGGGLVTPVLVLTFSVPSLKAEGGTGASVLHKFLPISPQHSGWSSVATWYSGGCAKHGGVS